MKILDYRKEEDQIWVGCSREEAETLFLPNLNKESLDDFERLLEERLMWSLEFTSIVLGMMRMMGHASFAYAYFNVSRDLTVCNPTDPYYPVSPWWNGYSPFVGCDHVEISSIEELREFVPTLDGKPIV